jgi:hypothetical protein
MDDPSVEVAINEPKVIYAMQRFEADLAQLRKANEKTREADRKLKAIPVLYAR